MDARDVMVSPVITIGENATVRDVAKLMAANRISAVPVVDGAGKVVGIVTEADLMRRAETGTERPYSWWLHAFMGDDAIAANYVKSHATRVADIMTREVWTATPESSLEEIVDLFETHHIKRVPILSQGGDLVGIVSRANIIQAIASLRPNVEITPSDATIRQKLLDELSEQRWTQTYKLNVTVANGIVDLWGVVASEQERKAINAAASSTPGVLLVNDHLRREPYYALTRKGWE